MAVLADADRAIVDALFQQGESALRNPFGALTKADIRAAVNAMDVFFDTNATAINNAFPEPAKSVLTTAQKARLVNFVIRRRYIGN